MDRRRFLAGTAAIVILPMGSASATPEAMAAAIAKVVGGAPVREGRVSLDLPPLVENGSTVPLVVSGVGVATSDEVERVIVLHEMLQRIESAVGDGIAVVGVRFEPIIDCYDWTAGWSAPGGLFDRERGPRPAAELVADTIAAATVPRDLEPYLERARER